jgi:hypothetical protein
MLTGSINFGTIEKVAETSSNGLDNSVIQSLPTSFLESKDGPALSVDSPASLSQTEITACGTDPVAFGYRDGTIALKVSGELDRRESVKQSTILNWPRKRILIFRWYRRLRYCGRET